MQFSPEWLETKLKSWPTPRRYVVLASGGMDSTVLLHAMATIADRLPAPVAALHFNHGLNTEADAWQQQVEAAAKSLGMVCQCESLGLDKEQGSVETRARTARYARLREWMTAQDCCLTAHHGDDQAETFLLQALRGSGAAGLAAMPEQIRFGSGWLARPLLSFTQVELRDWAQRTELEWVEDPGNFDLNTPRNRLRHEVWPHIAKGWPAAARTLGRSAALAAEASALIEEVATETLQRLSAHSPDRLPVPALSALSVPRRRAVLRYWLRRNDVDTPTAEKLWQLEHDFVLNDPGSRARLSLGGVEVRRFRDTLFLLRSLPQLPFASKRLEAETPVQLGALGQIELVADAQGPLALDVTNAALELRFRAGGERLRPAGKPHHRSLKKLLQERGVLPWMRDCLPCLYVDGALAAVGNLWVAEEFAGQGWRLNWRDRPVIE